MNRRWFLKMMGAAGLAGGSVPVAEAKPVNMVGPVAYAPGEWVDAIQEDPRGLPLARPMPVDEYVAKFQFVPYGYTMVVEDGHVRVRRIG